MASQRSVSEFIPRKSKILELWAKSHQNSNVSLSWNKFWNKFKSIGIFFPYIKESLDVNNTTTSLIFSIMMFFQYCGSLIGRDSNINYYQSDWFNPKDSDYSSLIELVINYLSYGRSFWALNCANLNSTITSSLGHC